MVVENNKLIVEVNKNTIKKTKKILRLCDKNNYNLVFKINGKNITKKDNLDLYNIQKSINIKNIKDRYSFIYDTVCYTIDKKYLDCNYCEFKDNVCIYFRSEGDINHKYGCCYGKSQGGLCKYLKNNKCSIKSISCKLYSCEYLRKRKINFRMKNIPLIKYFFNLKQKYYIKYSFFKPKNYVIYKLLEKR